MQLAGKIFISTRPAGKSDELADLFTAQGAQLIEMPLIEIQEVLSNEAHFQQLSKIDSFDWLLFTSPNGIRYFFAKLQDYTNTYSLPPQLKISVIGKQTAKVLKDYEAEADFINPGTTGEDFVLNFGKELNSQSRILVLQGNLGREIFEEKLGQIAAVERMVVYQTAMPEKINPQVLQMLEKDEYDMLIFTSPSAFINLYSLNLQLNYTTLRAACIGSTTADALLAKGVQPLVTAAMANPQGIANSIIEYYNNL